MLNKPSIAILIDCWDSGVKNRDIFTNIIKFLYETKTIRTVVLASYNSKYDDYSTLWYTNYFKMLYRLPLDNKLQEIYNKRKDLISKVPKDLATRTEPSILNFVDNSKYQISFLLIEELEYYLNTNIDITNIYVLGEAFDSCVGDRELGYHNLTNIPNVCILTNIHCVKNMDGSFPNLSADVHWEQVSEKIYRFRATKNL